MVYHERLPNDSGKELGYWINYYSMGRCDRIINIRFLLSDA